MRISSSPKETSHVVLPTIVMRSDPAAAGRRVSERYSPGCEAPLTCPPLEHGTPVKQTWESEMKTIILPALVAMAASSNTATSRTPAESAPTGELINCPDCGYPQGSFTWLLCDAFEG
jgi:hypothetical protein